MNDLSTMPWGAHKGKLMANVPDNYLKWLYENNKCSGDVKKYIEENADVLKIKLKK